MAITANSDNRLNRNYRKVNLKRKTYARGKKQNFKRFKKTPKFILDNPENQVARELEKDAYHFTDSEEDPADDLGMGLDLTDLPFLDENLSDNHKNLIALTQDSVRPLFSDETSYDESKLIDGLNELRLKSFRPNQKETVKRILFGRSTLFVSPTGSGKSLCYQLPALLYWRYRKYITIVVSPLISLMEDQMNNFPSSLKAVCLHSGYNRVQKQKSIDQLINGQAQVVFISPEAIVGGVLELDDLKNFPPVGFVCIDEAHCLSEWSQYFRPAYLQFFKILNDQMSIKTYLGLTATATKATLFAIARSLTINPETDVIGSTSIPENLILSVSYETNKEKALIELLKTPTFRIMPSIIIYCNRREQTETIASIIRINMQSYSTIIEVPERVKKSDSNTSRESTGSTSSSSSEKPTMKLSWNAESYHAGLPMEARKRIQREFIKGEIRVVVATIAFGMGINKSNVRAIVHFDMPSSFESYIQEIGRAGRDGKPAQCHMFLNSDTSDIYYQQRNIYSSITEIQCLRKLVDVMFKPTCRCENVYMDEPEYADKIQKLNNSDHHTISSWNKTDLINVEANDSDDEAIDDYQTESSSQESKAAKVTRYVYKSVVRKHRFCNGHEVTFPIEETCQELNLRPESIMTFICQLQQAYPQLKIKLYPPAKSICTLYCGKGPEQMDHLAKSSTYVYMALHDYRKQFQKENGEKFETPQKLSFDVVPLSKRSGKPSQDIIRMLKKTEWELVEKTGRFRRSQVRVKFGGNMFHLNVCQDLKEDELDEIYAYIVDYMKSYEVLERKKVTRVYETFKDHSLTMQKMSDKIARLQTSAKLKSSLNIYFKSSPSQMMSFIAHKELAEKDPNEPTTQQKLAIRNSALAFIDHHGTQFSPRAIARIFQGISTPRHPSEHWGLNKRWWRIHTNVDFLKLVLEISSIHMSAKVNSEKPK